MIDRGRANKASGERHGMAVHSDAFVAKVIRGHLASGRSMRATARKYGLVHATAQNWIKRETRSSALLAAKETP